MIHIISTRSEDSPNGRMWHTTCDGCPMRSETTSRPSVAIAAALDHQRRCPIITGQAVDWFRDGVFVAEVTPTLALGL